MKERSPRSTPRTGPASESEAAGGRSYPDNPPGVRSSGARSAVIFNIERHALHDGPGIRTLVFIKGCGLRCTWCSNPEGQTAAPGLLYREKDCIACQRCVEACPARAVSRAKPRFSAGRHTDKRPSGDRDPSAGGGIVVTDRSLCTACGACVRVCPAGARTIAGREMTTTEVLEAVLKDEVFYRNSGGGVTASGGEPLLRPEFVGELFEKAGVHGIHRAIETCGHVPWENIETVLPFTDLFLYDLKHTDPEVHMRFTGKGNSLILENLGRLDERGARLVVRVPLIPSFNDRAEDVRAIAAFTSSLRSAPGIELLPYHVLGRSKYHHLEKEYPMEGHGLLPAETLERLLEAARAVNPNTTLET
jgi:pyruvate formate lyase activating enzyme